MDDMLTGISSEYLYFHGKKPRFISDFHSPYFLAFAPESRNISSAKSELLKKIEENTSDSSPLSKIESLGEIETYRSFWDFDKTRKAFKVFTKKSYFVPEVSDHLFFYHNLYTGEHDIPYQQRSLSDLAAENKIWMYDSNGAKKKLKLLVYDIETTEYQKGSENVPIDIIGYSNFDVTFESQKNLETEEFSFDILDLPASWEEPEILQLVSNSVDEEIDNLCNFCKILIKYDIISGHNIVGFDNYQIYNRINWLIKTYNDRLSADSRKFFQEFLNKYAKPDKSFHFGVSSEAVQFYPASLDTYLGVRKFYSFLDDFSLKGVAPFLGIEIKDRLILTPDQMKIDDRTLKYNKHDVMEQLGVTLNLVQQVLPLSFTTCMPFDMLLSSGAVYMWDHMSMIRASMQKKIMPPICRVLSISQTLSQYFKGCDSLEDVVKKSKDKKEQLSKDFVRVIKYGDEMPAWMQDPDVIYNENHKDSDDILNYHMPGGMTIKPDKEADSHFVPWWYVVVADVGAMYPTILKAMNIGGDTVRLAKKSEKPDDYIWLKKISKKFLDRRDIHYRPVEEKDSFADKGYIIGVIIDDKPGVVNCAMTGIMSMIAKTKNELKETKKRNDKLELQRLKMMYQSVKGARNAGSVDYSQRIILVNSEGKYENIKIGEFVDKAIEKFGCFTEKINGTEFEIANIKDNWKAVSVNKDGKVEIKRVKQAVRHKWNSKLVKIWTKSGFTVVTPNHSVFTIRNGKISEISAEELKDDTLIVHANKIPNVEESQKTNLIKELDDCYAIPPKQIEFVDSTSNYVYDISVEDNENFVDDNGGILLHNTHGILAAPSVSGRQFNLWGATTITTKGQAILADSLDYLKNKGIRVVYGDSVGPETSIVLKDNELIKIVEIRDLFENCENDTYKKGNHEYKKLDDIECLSVTKGGKCEWKKADFVKRHPYSRNIVEVKTQRGKISVTKNHSLYTLSNGLKELSCDQIKSTTNIAHISHYDNKGTKIKINALAPLLKFNNELNIWLNISINQYTQRLLKYHQPRNNSKHNVVPNKFIRIKVSDAIDLYKERAIKEADLKYSFISSYNGKGKIPVIYDLDEDFARILGAYTAEGSIYIRKRKGFTKEGAHIFVCGHDFKSLTKLKKVINKKFKMDFKVTSSGFDKNGENSRIQGNSSTAYLFKFVLDCGQGSQGKKVSPYVLSSIKSVQKAFMDEYVRGEGTFETKRRVNPLLRVDTKSKKLVEGLSLVGLNLKYGYPSLYYREEKSCYTLRFVQYNLHSVKHRNLTGIPVKEVKETKSKDVYVYDISVQENNNFICANGLIPAHNTDGIYLGCSRSVGNIPDLSKALELNVSEDEKNWITNPNDAINAIEECNVKWQKELNYPDFELEPENHDAMIFVKHKNYLIFDTKNGKIELVAKGNNFKGSDKANIARKVLKEIMIEVLKENPYWENEEDARNNIKKCILEKTSDIVSKLDLKKVDLDDLTLVQSVQPAKRYKPNQDGNMSTFGKRAVALEKLIGSPIRSRVKMKFVVTKRSIPGITNPSKSGVKPIDFMYPIDYLNDHSQIDLDWYKKMIENYIQGAFGISGVATTEQTGLDAWM